MTETPALYGPTQAAIHTPGPYVVRNGSEIWKQSAPKGSPDGASMTYAMGFKVCDGVPEYVSEEDSDVAFRGAFAIAELLNRGRHFADLLAQLEHLLGRYGHDWHPFDRRDARELIAEAKGGSNAGDP